MATVTNTVKLYHNEGIKGIASLKRNANSDNARRKLDGRAEACLFEIVCSPAPEGHSRWTLLSQYVIFRTYLPAICFSCCSYAKHGSWLDIAEIELNVMPRQCLSRRIENIDLLRRKLAAWEAERN